MPPPPSASGAAATGSTSIVSARSETGWHVLKVEGYSKIKGVLGIGRHIKSGSFNVGWRSWNIKCYTGGVNKENASWMCVALNLDNPAASGDVMVCFSFSLLDHAGEPIPAYTTTSTACIYSSTNYSWGFTKFIERTVLESSWLNSDSFSIRCDITVVTTDVCTKTTMECQAVPPPDLHCHLGALLDTDVGRDVTFLVNGGEEFTAHRIVLAARSPVFMAELFGPMKETFESHVRIDDMEAKVFKVLLHYIYNDSLPEIDKEDKVVMAQHLLVAADKYNMDRLKLICADTLSKCVDTSLVATTLVLAEQHGCHGLKEACFKFLKSPVNMTATMAGDGFQHLKRSFPNLVEELLAMIAQ
ncbi:hypothetical protein PR202_gb13422 [Eleusine coracana subsp. coracana]|uniref:Uncharacterized protein n=1 Tax=Eleusine coracana subsp. coracana TaxID=191504 RepID=A0AAV5ES13_ELECO|nr:hypothetical protein QOZ80_9BG0714600 [Eleusine coracana subsp. coracana]GJN25577.1 hypothetical protein PR202_gb13422 [Eleusine coracana subsp. coracana]